MLACALVVGLTLAPTAEGHLLWHPDPKGDATVDDLVGVRSSTYRHDGVKMLRINVDLWVHDDLDACCDMVRVVFDTRGDAAADYALSQSTDQASGGVIFAELVRIGEGPVDVLLRRGADCGDVFCPAFPVRFKLGVLHPTKHIRWYVATGHDRAPDVGWFAH
jgi:hypothetical protein